MESQDNLPGGDADRRLWVGLTVASAASSVLVLPYALTLSRAALEKAAQRMAASGKRLPGPVQLGALAFVQGLVQFGLVSGIGLRLARSMGLGAPHLRLLLEGKPVGLKGTQAVRYAGTGAGAAIAMAALDFTVFRQVQDEMKKRGVREPEAWKGLLATTYGAIGEEVLMRLGVQTMLAAGIRRLLSEKAVPPTGRSMRPAIALSNLLFGAGHLPAARTILRLTPLLVVRTLVLNAIGGAVFGYLYWKEGLEASMIAHGSADIVVHVVAGPLLQGRK